MIIKFIKLVAKLIFKKQNIYPIVRVWMTILNIKRAYANFGFESYTVLHTKNSCIGFRHFFQNFNIIATVASLQAQVAFIVSREILEKSLIFFVFVRPVSIPIA